MLASLPHASRFRGRPPRRGWRGALLAALLLSALRPAAGQEPLTVLFSERSPYASQGPGAEVTGLTADPAAYALRKAGIPFRWVLAPPPRQLLKLEENQTRLAALGWFKNPERERYARFSRPLYQDRQIVVLALADNRRIAAARTLRELLADPSLGCLMKLGYSYGKDLDDRIVLAHPEVLTVSVENISMVQMIHAGRADYMFIAPEEAQGVIRQAGLKAGDFQLRVFPDMPRGEKRYLMFSRKVDEDTIKAINKYLDEFRATRAERPAATRPALPQPGK